ncbi:hypothetical protein ABZ252_26995 [Streptomyces sp. NPDC006175]|uniref:hypothetical protein n=1 Tax=unclassified Streptomyces TaxID=2593676 RepID=UPI0033ADF50E
MTADPTTGTPTGIIGVRPLVAVQTFGIARLTSDPVALIPGTFVAVTGRGPKDSNESGKTSFLAAVSLLLGDPEWQATGNGIANTATLLFEPIVAGASAQLVGAADRGYVVGLFAEAGETQPHTVWLQISSERPYLQARHQPGIHLLTEGDDGERHRAAPEFFRQLGGRPLGSGEYAQHLYGRSPKVLAYVASRGQVRSRPSLLKLEAATYTPDRIGEALLTLSGRSSVLERDGQQRHELAVRREDYNRAITQHDTDLAREDQLLEAVALREDLRTKVGSALADQRSCLARSVLDAVARQRSAEALLPATHALLELARGTRRTLRGERVAYEDVRALESAVRAAGEEHRQTQEAWRACQKDELTAERDLTDAEADLVGLRELAGRHAGEPVTVLTARLAALRDEVEDARVGQRIAEGDATNAEQELAKAALGQAGRVGELITALGHVGIDAAGLYDRTEVDPSARDLWEAVLHPWREAVCVPRSALSAAVDALRDHPGAVLVASTAVGIVGGDSSDSPALPAGILSAPESARSFLTALSRQGDWTGEPPHASMPRLGVHVVGAFPEPLLGREAICAHLRSLRDAALKRMTDLSTLLSGLATRIGVTEAQLACAVAVESMPAAIAKHDAVLRTLTAIRAALPDLKKRTDTAADLVTTAKAAVASREQRILALDRDIASTDKEIKELEERLTVLTGSAGTEQTARAIGLFGGDEETARTELGWPAVWLPEGHAELLTEAPTPLTAASPGPPAEYRSAADLRRTVVGTVDVCRTVLRVEARTKGYPTHALARAAEMHEAAPDVRTQPTLRALADWLDDTADADAAAESEIATLRQTRQRQQDFIASSVDKLGEQLQNTQAVIIQRVSIALDSIATALNRLDRGSQGFGADLTYRIDPPAGADHHWRCSVTPRWRRNPNGPLLSYDTVTNTAQEKLFSINLVLAALLAAPHPQGRVLILDELGDSLGKEHRREVLSAISSVATEYGITVLGTCQDTILKDAAPVCGEILYFHYPSKSEYLNLPTRMYGFDENSLRVELTAERLLRHPG